MLNEAPGTTGSNIILETSLAGDTLVYLEYGQRGFNRLIHHDIVMTDDHQFLAITESEKDGVVVDGLMKLDRSGNLVWQWDTSQEHPTGNRPYIQPWGNYISFDELGHIVVSFRRISQVWKVNKDTREVMWRLGRDGTIRTEGNDSFLLQHAASFSSPDELMMFDNGQDRTSDNFLYDDYRPYSRIAFYTLNENRTEVSESRFLNLDEKYFAWANGSVLAVGDTYLVGASITGDVLQLNLDGEIQGKMSFGDRFYRAEIMDNFLIN
jgi:arylsulfate sulfotransferase